MHAAFKKERSFEYRFKERQKLIKPFIEKYGEPILVHAVESAKTFRKIISEGELKTPKEHGGEKKTPHMEEFLGFNNRIFFSLGFFYSTAYNFKYGLIFNLNLLKETEYYRKSVSWQPYKKVADYWFENDFAYLGKLAKSSNEAKEVLERYLNKEVNGRKRTIFDFWKIEKELFEAILKHRDFNKLNRLIKKTVRDFKLKYPESKKDALVAVNNHRGTPEILSDKSLDLFRSKYFLGFYVNGKTEKKTLDLLRENYPGKIMFDGKRIRELI